MLDVALLGTGGMMPLPRRYLTSLYLRYNGNGVLIDCGEGTQMALRATGWSPKPIGTILLTHFHADHIAGLPGLLLTMGNADRTEPVTIVGPKGVGRIVSAVRTIAPELPFEVRTREIEGRKETFEAEGLKVTAFYVQHRVPCFSYCVEVTRQGRFDPERAKAQNIPLQFWNPLQKGQVIEFEGRTLTPEMVLGEERKGIKVVYSTDTRPTEDIVQYATGADLLICEGMYGDPEKAEDAVHKKHMTMQEACRIAAKAEPEELWLTHYSPSVPRAEVYLDELKEIFPRVVTARDGRVRELRFADEEKE